MRDEWREDWKSSLKISSVVQFWDSIKPQVTLVHFSPAPEKVIFTVSQRKKNNSFIPNNHIFRYS